MRPQFALLVLPWLALNLPAEAAEQGPRLLYARIVDDHCQVGVWHAKSTNGTTLAETDSCPELLFASAEGDTIFIVDNDQLRLVPTDDSTPARVLPMPDSDYHSWASQAELTMHPKNLDMMGTTEMQPVAAGFLETGEVAVQMRLNGPADGSINYLLRFANGRWQIEDELGCGTWDIPCLIESLTFRSSDAWLWPAERLIWHPDVSSNPLVVHRSVESARPDVEYWETSVYTLEFEIDGSSSVLTFFGNPSEHTETIHILGIDLSIDGGPAINLSKNQCLTSIIGRYLLVEEFFQGRFGVTDLGTGEWLIGDLKAAMWLD